MVGYIYKWENLVNGKVYIGMTCDLYSRKYFHLFLSRNKDRGTLLHRAIRKHGEDNFSFTVIFTLFDYSADGAEYEKLLIKEHEGYTKGYNLTEGGEGNVGMKHSEETKQKMSAASKGKPKSEEHKQNLSKSTGTKIQINGNVYESISKARQDLHISDRRMRKMISEGTAIVLKWGPRGGENSHWFGKKIPEDQKEKSTVHRRKPVCVYGVMYPSRNEASRALGKFVSKKMFVTGVAFYVNKETGEPIPYEPEKPN